MRNLLRRLSWVPPCLIGAAAFFAVVGPGVLSPTNVGWLKVRPDSMTHYLGWVFFRHSPWTMPLGLNPRYGLELGSSIVYSDSIPLLALIFKPLSPWLPEPFQYSGLWLLACFALQALFGWILVGLATRQTSLRLAGCALFPFAPPMLFRLAGHWALVGHWTILAALVLALRPGRRRQAVYWALLGAVAALVHMYLLLMVTGIWLGAWAGDAWCRGRRRRALAMEMAVVPVAILTAMWQAGFFAVGEGKGAGGFGGFRFNLVAPVNAMGWSFVLPDIAWRPDDYEGFAFLGLGALLAGAIALHAALRLRARGALTLPREWVPLGLVFLGFTAVAASNNVGFGLHGFSYPLPPWLWPAAGMVRASGRLFWPVFYALLLAIVALIARAYSARMSFGLLMAAVAVQVADTSAGWRNPGGPQLHRQTAVRSPLTSAYWYDAPTLYRRVRLVPPGNVMDNWAVIADYAARQGLATDAIYSARVDRDRAAALFNDTMARLADGTFDRQSFYILQGGTARRAPCALDPQRDQLAWVDGFWVLMPGWKTRFGERYAGEIRLDCPTLSPETAPLEFVAESSAQAALSSGWSNPEPWGTWSDGPRSTLNLRVRGPVSALEFTATAPARPGPPLRVEVSVDRQLAATWQLAMDLEPRAYRLVLPDNVAAGEERTVRVSFAYSDIRSPASLGESLDQRRIALALRQVRAIRPTSP